MVHKRTEYLLLYDDRFILGQSLGMTQPLDSYLIHKNYLIVKPAVRSVKWCE